MRWRMILEVAGADGTWQVHEIGAGKRSPTGHTAATLGLGLEEGKALLAALQRHLVAAQVDEHCRSRRRCDRCGAQRPLIDPAWAILKASRIAPGREHEACGHAQVAGSGARGTPATGDRPAPGRDDLRCDRGPGRAEPDRGFRLIDPAWMVLS